MKDRSVFWIGIMLAFIISIAFLNTSASVAGTALPLPQSVYDDWANPALDVVNMPQGTFYMTDPLRNPLEIKRSNVTVNFTGCTLVIDPALGIHDGLNPIKVRSVTMNPPQYPTTQRWLSHVTGQITTATTQLTMDPAEVVDLKAGEMILIWAGVNVTDPAEAARFIPAVVQSVNTTTRVITFTKHLGVDIPVYASEEALKAATGYDAALYYKMGPWGQWYNGRENFSKGLGLDHGIERFQSGGMLHDITFNNPTLEIVPVSPASIPSAAPYGMMDIDVQAVKNFTVNNLSVHNPFGSALHFMRSFDTLVNGATITGSGLSEIWNEKAAEATAFGIWGGERMVFRNVSVSGTDIAVFNVEISVGGIWLDGLGYDVIFTNARNYMSPTQILGFFSTLDRPRVSNANIRVSSTGGPGYNYYANKGGIDFDGNLTFSGSSLMDWLSWQNGINTLGGTVTINSVTYGPAKTETRSVTIVHGATARDVLLPTGLYTSIRFRATNRGDLRGVTDSKGIEYWNQAAQNGQWVSLNPDFWQQIPPGDSALAYYLAKKMTFWMNNAGSTADATVEIEYTYLPSPNRPPVANAQSLVTNEDTALGITLTGSGPDGNPLRYRVVSLPGHGSLSCGGASGNSCVYTPAINYFGRDSIRFMVNDGITDSSLATVSVTVNPVNDAPVVSAITTATADVAPFKAGHQVYAGSAVTYKVTATDADNDPLTWQVYSRVNNSAWAMVLSGTGSVAQGSYTFPLSAAGRTYQAYVVFSDGKTSVSGPVGTEGVVAR